MRTKTRKPKVSQQDAESQQPHETFLVGLASNLTMAVVVLFVFAFVFQNFVIPSSSMASTLLPGDHVLVWGAAGGLGSMAIQLRRLAPPTP